MRADNDCDDDDLDAEEERLAEGCRELLERVQGIDRQLAERRPIGRVSDASYREWRQWRASALHAREKLQHAYRDKKAALKALRRDKVRAAQEYLEETDGADGIIKALVAIAVELRAYENPRHQRTIDRARAFLGQEGG